MLLVLVRSSHKGMYFATIWLSLFLYVSHTNQIPALGYVSRTNYIIAFGYIAPITAFEYCFLVNNVMESGGPCKRNETIQKFWTHLISVMVVAFVRASSIEVEIFGL